MALIEARVVSILSEVPAMYIFQEYTQITRDWVRPFKDIPLAEIVYGYLSDVTETERYNLELEIILELDRRLNTLTLQNLKAAFILAVHNPDVEIWFTKLYKWKRYTECYIVLSLIHPNYGRSNKFKKMMNKILNIQVKDLNMSIIGTFITQNYGDDIYDYYYDWIKDDEYPDRSIK